MSVFYKFKSALNFDTIQFDDLHISLQDFKKAVIQQKQLGKNTNFDLQVTNAETNEVYSEENGLIPKNSSLIVVRVPLAGLQKKLWDIGDHLGSKIGALSSDYMQENAGNIVVKSADLAALNASEEEKIQAMMFQSTVDYDPANYARIKGGNQTGEPPAGYICHKCRHSGHWIKDCPITVVPDIKKSSGIPQSFMTPVVDPSVPGALMTPTGTFAVPTIDMHAYKEGKKEKPYIPSEITEESVKPIIPDDLQCALCQDLLTDAVMMPCCGNSFCDECIRNVLLESDENQCPDCKEKDTSPETLIPNRFLRNAVNTFRNKTGYSGGGQSFKKNNAEPTPAKSPIIEQDQDIEIIGPIIPPPTVEPAAKVETVTLEEEKGTAILVLGADGPMKRGIWNQPNMGQKMPTIHVEHRPPPGRPKIPSDVMSIDGPRSGNGMRASPDTIIEIDRNKSSPIMGNGPPHPNMNRHPGSLPPGPNTSQLPPGFAQQSIQSIGTHFAGNVAPIMPNYGPPPVNALVGPPHMPSPNPPVRMYPPYANPNNIYPPQVGGGYRNVPNHHRMRMHPADTYSNRNIVEDPLEAFERHLREREKQDQLRRNRGRRSRSRSPRATSRSRSRPRSRSRSTSKKRSHSKSPLMGRKESPQNRRDSRSPPVIRRSKSKSRSRTRGRSRSRSMPRNSMPRSKSPSPKKKRSISLSPSPAPFKKRSRSTSPMSKKVLRSNRSRTRSPRSRSRSKSMSRMRKRRRTKSRTRSPSSRSLSRGRSYSRSPLSPRGRIMYSPTYQHRVKRLSRSPPRHHFLSSRHRGNYRDNSPYQQAPYETSEHHRGYRRGGRNPRYHRGSSRYHHNSNYETNKYDRYAHNESYEDKRRYFEPNNDRGGGYFHSNNDHSKNRKDNYFQPPPPIEYDSYSSAYGEVPPPGTTDIAANIGYNSGAPFSEGTGGYNDRADKFRRTPEYEDKNSYNNKSNYKDFVVQDEWKKSKDYDREKEHDHHHRRSRERHGRHGSYNEHEKAKRHDSRTRGSSHTRVASPSPPERRSNDKKHRSRGHSGDKENRQSSSKREAADAERVDRVAAEKREPSPEHEKAKMATDEKKDEYKDKEKKEKSKRKKKKESDAEKKKKKKVRSGKKDDEAKADEEKVEKTDESMEAVVIDEVKTPKPETKNDGLYGDIEGTSVDTRIIESYGKIDLLEEEEEEEEKSSAKNEDVMLAPVPELSKWEREESSTPTEEQKTLTTKAAEIDDKKVVTNEILKRAENALFQKSTKATTRVETKLVDIPASIKEKMVEKITEKVAEKVMEKDDVMVVENAREARKSGNSIQVTVAASSNKSDDESRSSAPSGRIPAKDRLGAKVEEKHIATVRSLVEPKIKPRSLQSTVKSVVDVKYSAKMESSKHEKSEKPEESSSKKHDDKRKKESRHHSDTKHHSKHRDKEGKEKSKSSRKHSEEESKARKEAKEKESTKSKSKEETNVDSKKEKAETVPEKTNGTVERNANDLKSILDKKRPCLDEANFEPDYDLTSESENEMERKRNIIIDLQEPPKKVEIAEKEAKSNFDKVLIQKFMEAQHLTSTATSTDSSTDSSNERRKRKKKKSRKKRKAKKRKTYSSDSESEESSDSDSDSDVKPHKRKKKHKHKAKKSTSSKTAKKKKKSKHK